MERKDYYEILEVEREATPQQIKEAYRRLAFQCHPDRNNGDATALERMKVVNEAYAVLSDSAKRSRYDGLRDAYGYGAHDRFRENYTEEDIFRGSDIGRIFEEMARSFGVRGFEETFGTAYGSNYRTFQFGNAGIFGRGFIFTSGTGRRGGNGSRQQSLTSAIFPGILGKLIGFAIRRATGFNAPQAGADRHEQLVLRPDQAAGGAKIYYTHDDSREVLIKIPPGVHHGQIVRLRGLGGKGRGGGAPGDLFLKVEIKKPLLERIKEVFRP